MHPREEARKRLERDIMGFRILKKAFQEIVDKTSRRIEEIKYLGKEIYGMDLGNTKTVGEQFELLFEKKGKEKYLDWTRLVAEGMMLEAGREYLKKRQVELEFMLRMLEDTLAKSEGK